MLRQLLDQFDTSTPQRCMALFCNLFIQQNRMQTACEKVQTDISMKQWLLLAMLEECPSPKTLTNVGKLMGCSRQNVKKLALALEKKGYLTLSFGSGNSLLLNPTEKVAAYSQEMDERRGNVLRLLFSEFTQEEIAQFYTLHRKLYTGIERVEAYADSLSKGEPL